MATPINQLLQSLEKIKTRSITDPIFYIAGLMFILTVILICLKATTVYIIILCSIGIIAFFVGLFVYLYYAIKNPDYIRSEHYQLQKQQLTMLGDSNNKGNANMNLLPIANPHDNSTGGKNLEK
jgi:hypothetical protein